MRLSPAAASGVEVTGAPIVGLLLSGPAGSAAAATLRALPWTGRIRHPNGRSSASDTELSELLRRADDKVARRLGED